MHMPFKHLAARSCAGDTSLMCGGTNEILVHELPVADREVMGCFDDPAAEFAQQPNGQSKVLSDMTLAKCRNWATESGCNYYAVQPGGVCSCAFLPEQPTLGVPSGECTTPCKGEPSRACGGTSPAGDDGIVYALVFDPQGAIQLLCMT